MECAWYEFFALVGTVGSYAPYGRFGSWYSRGPFRRSFILDASDTSVSWESKNRILQLYVRGRYKGRGGTYAACTGPRYPLLEVLAALPPYWTCLLLDLSLFTKWSLLCLWRCRFGVVFPVGCTAGCSLVGWSDFLERCFWHLVNPLWLVGQLPHVWFLNE